MSARAKIILVDNNSGAVLTQFRANSGYVDFGISVSGIIQGGQFIGVEPASGAEIDYRFTATAATTHKPHLIINLVSGQNITVYIGDIGLFDITQIGLV